MTKIWTEKTALRGTQGEGCQVSTPEVKKRENAYIEDNHTSELIQRWETRMAIIKRRRIQKSKKWRRINIIICKLQHFSDHVFDKETEGRRGKQEDNYEQKLKIWNHENKLLLERYTNVVINNCCFSGGIIFTSDNLLYTVLSRVKKIGRNISVP